jgi:hypothetical protein
VWVDLDREPADAALCARLDGVVVRSGQPGHQHLYVLLSRAVSLVEHAALGKALAAKLGGDAKWSDESLLRLPGTLNWKPAVLGDGEPAAVAVESFGGRVWSPEELAALLGVDLAAAEQAWQRQALGAVGTVAVDRSALPISVLTALDAPTEDRSAAHHRLVAAAYDAGLSRDETHALIGGYGPSVAKFGERVAGETDRSWSAIAADRRQVGRGWPRTRAEHVGRAMADGMDSDEAQAEATALGYGAERDAPRPSGLSYADPIEVLATPAPNVTATADRAGGVLSARTNEVSPNGVLTGSAPTDEETAAELRYRREVAEAVRRMRVTEDARALLAAEKARTEFGRLPSLISLNDALTQPEETEQWRIADLLPEGGNATLVAPEKAGKTTLVGNLVRSLVDRVPFLGRFAVEPITGRVGVLNFEVTGRMFTRWLGDMGIQHTDQVMALHLRGHRLPLVTDEGVTWLVDRLREADVSVLVVDPFGAAFRSAGGVSENDNSEVGRFLSALDEVKQRAGIHELIMPVHAKREQAAGAERARAASVLNDWPDAIWMLVKDARRYLSARGRDVAVPEQRIDFDPTTRALAVTGGSRRSDVATAAGVAILAVVTQQPGITGRSIESTLADEHTRLAIRDALAKQIRQGAIRAEAGPRNSICHFPGSTSAPCPRQ